MSGLAILGTDTNVGKTWVTAALVSAFLRAEQPVTYWKPVLSGIDEGPTDPEQIRRWTGLAENHFLPTCYRLKAPLSPPHAAQLEGITIDMAVMLAAWEQRPPNRTVVVETAGGALSPLDDYHSQVDLIREIQIPALVVVEDKLGAINQACLAVEAIRHRDVPIYGVVLNRRTANFGNAEAIERYARVPIIAQIPPAPEPVPAYFYSFVESFLRNTFSRNPSL